MKQGLIFLAGIGIGGVVGWFASKKYYERRLDAELEEMKNYYISKEEDSEEPVEHVKMPQKPSLEELRKKYAPSDEDASEEYYEHLAAEYEHPVDSDEEEEFIDGLTKEEWDSVGYEQKIQQEEYSQLEPVIISVDDFGEFPNFDATELIYHQRNDILMDEDGNEMEDRGSLVGECMTKFAFEDSDEEDLFVRNYKLATDYHIHKILDK